MTGLTRTVFEAVDERLTDPEKWHPRARTEDQVAAEFPEPKRAQRLVHEFRGQKFRPHGTDSVGVILSHPRSRQSVQFAYEHDRATVHSMRAHEFTDKFGQLVDGTRRPRKAASVRHVRPTPAAAIATLKEAA